MKESLLAECPSFGRFQPRRIVFQIGLLLEIVNDFREISGNGSVFLGTLRMRTSQSVFATIGSTLFFCALSINRVDE